MPLLKQTQTWIQQWHPFFITLGTLILSSCGSIKIPVDVKDETLYFIKGNPALSDTFSNYAVEMHFLTSGQTDLTKAELDLITQGMVMMPLQAFDDFNTEIGKLCSQLPCDYTLVSNFRALWAQLHLAANAKGTSPATSAPIQ